MEVIIIEKLTNKDIMLNNVDIINQFKVLQYLKDNLNIYEFEVFLYDKDTIKVVDINNEIGYFKYNKNTKEIDFKEENKTIDFEI